MSILLDSIMSKVSNIQLTLKERSYYGFFDMERERRRLLANAGRHWDAVRRAKFQEERFSVVQQIAALAAAAIANCFAYLI